MKHRRTLFPLVAMAACFALVLPTAFGFQDPLNRGRGNGGGSQGGQKQNPPRNDPPRQNPPRNDPPKQNPPKNDPPRNFPPRQDPPKREDPPRNFPPKQDPPRREDPPRNFPPRNDPPRREDPPARQDPPRREDPGRRLPPKEDPPRREDPPGRQDPPKREDYPRRREDPVTRNDNPINRGGNVGGDQGSTGRTGGQRTGMEEFLRRKSGSRSGTVKYDSNSNRFDRSKGAISIDRIPSNFNKGSMGGLVRRADEIRVGNLRIRFGYNHYDNRWCDDYFYYPYYIFDPYAYNDWVFSPWYYYPQLPPYFNSRRCYFPTTYLWTPFYGVRYVWRQPSREYWNRDYSELDYVVEDIVNAFTYGDRRAVDRLIPQRGSVAIITDGRFAYQMRPDDFYDTFLDAVENTRTINYRILDVQYRRDVASIYAQHDFEDPWGRRTSVYHYYKVEVEGRNWVIREFGTSYNRW